MKEKLKTDLCCDVCACKNNIDGCLCNKDSIKITTGKTDSAHYCGDYQPK